MMDDLPGNTERKICLCLGVTDQTIGACYQAGHRDLDEIRSITRACTRCFGCESDLRSFYNDILVPGKFKLAKKGLKQRLLLAARQFSVYALAQRQYHRHVRWRFQPMVFGSVIVERPDLHSRVFMANVNRRADAAEFRELDVKVQLLDDGGNLVYEREHHLSKDTTLVLDARDMIGGRGKGLPFLGAVVIQGRRRHIGSLRTYTHYFNDASVASTHDQWTPDATRHHGFCTMVRVPSANDLAVYLTVSNIEPRPYRSKVLLTNHLGRRTETDVEIDPYGTALLDPRELFSDFQGFLEGKLGTVRFENWSHRAMYYFFAHDRHFDTWNVNHL